MVDDLSAASGYKLGALPEEAILNVAQRPLISTWKSASFPGNGQAALVL